MSDYSRFRPPEDAEAESTEGVRILGAVEAAEAAGAEPPAEEPSGDPAGRRPPDQPRYGDRPASMSGPPDALRFPRPASEHSPPSRPTGPTPELPHWTEPATGEVPRVLMGEGDPSAPGESGPRWREGSVDWDDPGYSDVSRFADDDMRLGALDPDRPSESDMYSFGELEDDEYGPDPTERTVTSISSRRSSGPPPGGPPAGGPPRSGVDRNLPVAIGVGVGIAAVALLLFSQGPGWTMWLVVPVLVAAAAELSAGLRRAEYQPATLVALVAVAGMAIGTWWKGPLAILVVLFLALVVTLLWYVVVEPGARMVAGVGATLLTIVYVGVMGTFAVLLLLFPNGVGLLMGVAVGTVAYDVGGFFVGRSAGRSQLAPGISPGKTYEGLIGGMVLALVVCVVIAGRWTPWGDFLDALRLGVVVAIAAPIGDLCESALKRDLGLKDSGGILPGHGGLLDRFDGFLFTLPATYFLVVVTGLA